jgi:pimeloyl-ACP methyl ester carboxylesterase
MSSSVAVARHRRQLIPPTGNWLVDVGSGDCLVFLHGGEGPAKEQLLAHLGDRRVIAPTLPGLGGLDCPADWSDVLDYVDFVSQLVTDLQIGPVDLVGHSFGGFIASELLLRRPALVRRLVLSAPSGFVVEGVALPDVFALAPAEITELLYNTKPDPDATPDPVRVTARGVLERIVTPMPSDPQLLRRLRGLEVDTLVLRGARDALIPARYCHAVAEALQAEFQEISDSGHATPHLVPAAFAEHVRAFLDQP